MAVTCTGCGAVLNPPAELGGKKVRCRKCGTPVYVPAAGDAPTQAHGSADGWHTQPPRERMPSLPPLTDPTAGTMPPNSGTPSPEVSATIDLEAWDFLAPAQEPGEIGRLGTYRVLKVLGAGGMGIVFQAEDLTLRRNVAIKAMRPAMACSTSAKQRFLREAQTAAALEHDHIVPIYQVGEDRGVPFIAMPLLRGEPLDVRLDRDDALPIREILRIGRETAEGLAAAHAAGLIHRDIKPANLWLEAETGRVKILDFGLARNTADQQHLTQQGAIIGTPAYMAPEQATGQPLDARCDLFSLGCVLYRMTAGELPFKGTDAVSTLLAVATTEPRPPHKVRPKVPAAASEFIMRLLAKNPALRPQSARVVAESLRTLEHAPPEPAPTTVKVVKPKDTAITPAEPTRSEPPRSAPPRAASRSGVRAQAARPPRKRRGTPPWMYALVGGGVALVALVVLVAVAIIVLWPAPHETVRPEPHDPKIKVAVGDAPPVVAPVDAPPTVVEPQPPPTNVPPRGSPLNAGPAKQPRFVNGWGEVDDAEGDSVISGDPGKLTIEIPGAYRDLLPGRTNTHNAPRVLEEVGDDFVVQVKVANDIRAPAGSRIAGKGGMGAFQSGGLLLWQDRNTFVRLERVSEESKGKSVPLVLFAAYQDGQAVADAQTQKRAYGAIAVADLPTHLRLERRQGKVYPSFSQDGGKTWRTDLLAPVAVKLPPTVRVGVAVVNNTMTPLKVEFTELRITRAPAVAADSPGPKVPTEQPHARIPWRDPEQVTSAHIYQTGVSPDGKLFFGGGDSGPAGIIRIFEVATGREVQRLNLGGYPVWFSNAAFVPGNRYLVAGYSKAKDAFLWDLASGAVVRRYIGHTQVGVDVAVSPTGKRLLTWGEDRTVRLWDLMTGKALRKLQGHGDKAAGVFSPDGTRILTYSPDKTLQLWETDSGRQLQKFVGHTAACTGSFSPSGKEVLSFSADGTIRLWSTETGKEIRRFEGGKAMEGARGFIAGGRQVAAYCEDQKYRIWDTATAEIVQTIDLAGAGRDRASFTPSPDGRVALVGAGDNSVRVYDLRGGREILSYPACPAARAFSFTPDGAWSVGGSFRAGLYVFRLPAGKAG
jgi:serine/threonine protein kinase